MFINFIIRCITVDPVSPSRSHLSPFLSLSLWSEFQFEIWQHCVRFGKWLKYPPGSSSSPVYRTSPNGHVRFEIANTRTHSHTHTLHTLHTHTHPHSAHNQQSCSLFPCNLFSCLTSIFLVLNLLHRLIHLLFSFSSLSSPHAIPALRLPYSLYCISSNFPILLFLLHYLVLLFLLWKFKLSSVHFKNKLRGLFYLCVSLSLALYLSLSLSLSVLLHICRSHCHSVLLHICRSHSLSVLLHICRSHSLSCFIYVALTLSLALYLFYLSLLLLYVDGDRDACWQHETLHLYTL